MAINVGVGGLLEQVPPDISGSITIVGQANLGPAAVAGADYRTLLEFGNDGVWTTYVWVGELDVGGGNAYLRLWVTGTAGTDLQSGFFEVPYGEWFGWAYRYNVATGYHELWVKTATAEFERVGAIYNPLSVAADVAYGSSAFGTTDIGLAAYERRWARRLTIPQMQDELASTTVVDTADLEYDTPFAVDALDDSGNGNDWVVTGTPTYDTQPTLAAATYATPEDSIHVSSFVKAAGASQVIAGLPFTAAAVMFHSTLRQSTGFETADQRQVFGVSDGVNDRGVYHGSLRASADTAHGYVTDACIIVVEFDNSTSLKGHVSAFGDGTITITWDTDTGAHDGAIINFTAWSDQHICGVGDFQAQNSSSQAVTLPNSADLVIMLAAMGTSFPDIGGGFGPNGVGWTTKTEQGCSSNDHALGGGNPRLTYQRTNGCIAAKGFAGVSYEGRRVTLSGTTLTMNFTPDFHAFYVFYLAIENITARAVALTAPGANDTDTIELAGRPMATMVMSNGMVASTGTSAEDEFSFGAADRNGNQRGTWSCARDGVGDTARHQSSALTLVTGNKASGTVTTQESAATVTAAADSVDVGWTITNADSAEVLFLVMGLPYVAPAAGTFTDGDPGTIPTFELTLKDDTVLPFSNHEGLNDRAEYYGGRKDPLVSSFRPIRRALSGSAGQLEHVRFGVELIDEDRVFRALREDAVNRILTGRPVAVRTVSDADRRAELPMRLEMAGYVAPQYGARPGLNYSIECVDWLKARLARRNTQPEYWQETFSRTDFPLLPDDELGKAMHLIYGRLSDEIAVDVGIYPRDSWDPGWVSLGYNHLAAAGPPAGGYCAYVTVIKDGKESTLTPFQVGFGLDGTQQAYIYFKTSQTADLYRVYFADGQAFHPFYNPTGTTFARYQDFDPNVAMPTGCEAPATDPFSNPNTEQLRYVLLDSVGWGSDYADIAVSGGVIINAGTGPVPTRYVGEMTHGGVTRSAFHVCRGAISDVAAAYLGGVKVAAPGSGTEVEVPFLGDYATVFGANFIDVNGRRHTIAFLTGQAAVDAISGARPLTLSLSGYETVGNTTGDLIVTPAQQLAHFADNFLAPAIIPATTWVVAQAEFPHIAGLPLVDQASFTAVDAVHADRIPGGYETAGIIGEGGAFESAEDIIADFCKSGDFDVEFNRLGQLAGSAEPETSPAEVIALDDVHIIDDGSFEILADGDLRDFWNLLPFSHTKDMTSRTDRGWMLTGLCIDQDSIDDHGQRLTSDDWQLRFCRAETAQGGDTVVSVMLRKQLRYREPIDRVKLSVPYLEGTNIRNGAILSLDHVEGNGADGWEGHEVRVTAVEYQPDSQTLVVDAYDMEPIYAGLPDATEPGQTPSGLRAAQSVVQLQSQANQGTIDVTTIQAEIVSIDARVTALESGILRVLEEDPASPEDMTAWIVFDKASGLRVLRMYDDATGTTVDIASVFEPT